MEHFTLVIANKNYSSWSLRPWLVLRYCGIPFQEIKLALDQPETQTKIAHYSPSGRVPVLIHDQLTVWDSLAICEYLAECYPQHRLWPANRGVQAIARSISAEMHSGFNQLRQQMPMNCRKQFPQKQWPAAVMQEVERIVQIWQQCRDRYGSEGPYLFGHFTIADALFAPVVFRFQTYSIPLPALAQAYVESVLAIPAMQTWLKEARTEPEVITKYEISD